MRTALFIWLPLGFGGLMAQDRASSDPVTARPAANEEKNTEHYRAVAENLLSSTNAAGVLKASNALTAGFPISRPVLLEMLEKSSMRSRLFAVKILGDKGNPADDLDIVCARLKDPNDKVRLAAVMAIRRLGKQGLNKIVEYLPTEVKPNNRKMAVNTLQDWRDKAAIPPLAKLLRREKKKTVRNFIVKALESLSEQKLGHDVEAWEAVAEAWEQERLSRIILEHKEGEK